MQRPFRLTDLMILIAAVAIGFGIVREGATKARAAGYTGFLLRLEGPEWLIGPPPPGGFLVGRMIWVPFGDWRASDWPTRLMGAWTMLGPCLLSATVGTMMLRLWPPRPSFGDLWRQPGWVGCAVATLVLAATIIPCATFALRTGSGLWIVDAFEYAILFGPIAAGAGVLIAWSAMLAARRWRADGSWVDRLGILLALLHVASGCALAWFFKTRL